MRKPVIIVTFAYIAGLLLGHGFLYFPCTVSFLIILGLVAAALLTVLRRLALSRALLFAIPGLIGCAAYLFSALWLPSDHYTRVVSLDRTVHAATGRIASALERDSGRTAFVLDLREMDGRQISGKVRVSVRQELRQSGYDDVLTVKGRLFEPRSFNNPGGFDYAAHLKRNGIHWILSVRNSDQIHLKAAGSGIFRTIQNWREQIRQAFLMSISGPASAILQAMVLGEEGGLTDDLRDRFLAAGVTHIISISGSHLGMVAVVCFGLMRLLMLLLPERLYHLLTIHADPRKIAALVTLPLVLFYTLLAGGQVVTIRSFMMIGAGLAALLLDRENALLHSLALAALLILLADPQAIFDISFQLSFLSVATIGSVVMLWSERPVQNRTIAGKLREAVVLLVIISLSATIATGPLVAHYFNQFSLAGVVSNVIIVPFAGMVVVPLGLLSGILSLFSGSLPLAGLLQAIGDSFIETVAFFSRLPFAEFHPAAPGILWLLAYTVLVGSLFSLVRSRVLFALKPLVYSSRVSGRMGITALVSFLFLIAFSARGLFPGAAAGFPDVGQGDCALIQLDEGKNILIDGGGTYDDRFDTGRRVVAPYLWNRGVRRLDLVILSHPHPDHMNGLKYILNAFAVREIWTHGLDRDLPGYGSFAEIIAARNIPWKVVSAEKAAIEIGGARLSVLHPAPSFSSFERKRYAAENDRALVVKITFSNQALLFTGDIGTGAEAALIRRGVDLKADLVKVPHHGSKSSSSDRFIAAVRPSIAVVPVGRDNPYHHPSDEVIARYERAGTRIFRMDRDGAVLFRPGNDTLRARTWSAEQLQQAVDFAGEQENWKRLWIRKWEL
jgi:competence protein ComEC